MGKNKSQPKLSFDQIVFQELVRKWQSEIAVMSFEDQKHPLFQKIVGYGPKAIPWLFQELRERRSHRLIAPLWFLLEKRKQFVQVPAEEQGIVNVMVNRYVDWGKANGYL